MRRHTRIFHLYVIALFVIGVPAGITEHALAQTAQETTLAQPTIRALQEALNRQGIAVTADGILNEATREAIRKYQSVHHLPVTGEPDKATLNKLGIAERSGSAKGQSAPLAQAPAGPSEQLPAQMPMMQGNMMNCSMMQGQMQTMQGEMQQMMQMMQGMMKMMQAMKDQAPTGR